MGDALHHGRGRNVRLAALVVFGLLVTCASPALADSQGGPLELALRPIGQPGSFFDLTMLPGETRSLEVEIANHGDAEIAARTYAADVYTIINGGFGGRLRDEPATGTTRWLDYRTDVLDMAVGSSIDRSFTVSVPPGTGPGEYITSLVLENDQPIERDAEVGVDQFIRQAIAVVVTVPGQRSPSIGVGLAGHEVVAGRSILSVAVENSGNVRLKPLVDLILVDRDGAQVSHGSVQMDSFYAVTDTFVELPLNQRLLPGEYSVRVVIEDAAHDIRATATLTLVVAAPSQSGPPAAGVVPGLTEVNQGTNGLPSPLWLVALLVAGVLGASTMWFLLPRRRATA